MLAVLPRFRPLTGLQRTLDIGGAVLFGLVTLPFVLVLRDQSGTSAAAAVAVVLLLSGALAVRRLAPGLALTVAWVGAIVQMATVQIPSLVDLAILGVLYTTSAYGSRRVMWWGLGSAVVGAFVVTGYLAVGPFDVQGSDPWTPNSIFTVVAIATLFALLLAWTVGALVRTAHRAQAGRAAQERAQAQAAAEQHRARIARDMHDIVAHSLAVIVAQADGGRYAAANDPQAATAALTTIASTARVALTDVRLLLTQLRHRESEGPQPTLADLDGLFAQVRDAGAALVVDIDPAPSSEPPGAVQLAVYRIVQEALTNALRHGAGGPVAVRVAWLPVRVDLEIRNVVRAGAERGPDGHGIIGMRERAQLVGGTLAAGPVDGGFVVAASLPVPAPPDADEESGGHA